MFTGYELNGEDRNILIHVCEPKFPKIICHHVTHKFGVPKDEPPPKFPKKARAIAYCKGENIDCVIVEIDGTTERPDGLTYHVTLSLDPSRGAKPVDSNKIIKTEEHVPFKNPIVLNLIPKNFHNLK